MKIEITVSTTKVGSSVTRVVDYDDADWAAMTDVERNEAMYELMMNKCMFSWDWKELP